MHSFIASNDTNIVSGELERTWKEAYIASFKVLYQHFPGESEENYQEPQLD
jgi:hypothetical protein